jgi:hypothetical protein
MNLKPTPKNEVLYVVATPNSQVLYLESDIMPGLTIDEYRRSRPRRPSRWERLKSLGGGAQPAAA